MKTKQRSITLTPEESRGLLDGSVRELWRKMKEQPHDEWTPDRYGEIHKMVDDEFPLRNGLPIVIGWGALNRDGDWGMICPYKPGDVLLGKEKWRWYGRVRNGMAEGAFEYHVDLMPRTLGSFSDPYKAMSDFRDAATNGTWNRWRGASLLPEYAARHHLTVTAVAADLRDGVWGWVLSVERKGGNQ